MKITKYPQSCIMIETNNKKILIDAGGIKYQDKFLEIWKTADIILITHKHGDHIKADVLKDLNIPIYSTNEVQNTYPEIKFNIVKENDIITLDNIKIEVVHAIHGYQALLKGAKEVHENVGYIIDDGKNRLYTTSDTICFKNDYKADILCIPGGVPAPADILRFHGQGQLPLPEDTACSFLFPLVYPAVLPQALLHDLLPQLPLMYPPQNPVFP